VGWIATNFRNTFLDRHAGFAGSRRFAALRERRIAAFAGMTSGLTFIAKARTKP
jgi:hypothetical protein